jgi:hypothetical protein
MFNRYVLIFFLFAGCHERSPQAEVAKPVQDSKRYRWTKLSDSAAFLPTDRLQFLNIRDTLWVFHPNGNYYSTDGTSFQLSSLEPKLSGPAIPCYLFSNNRLISVVAAKSGVTTDSSLMITYKSADLLQWNQKTKVTSIPFINPLLIGFKGKIWMFGASDSLNQYVSAWNSDDAIHWTKMGDSISFGPITDRRMIVFKKKLLLLSDYLWESENGTDWKKVPTSAVPSLNEATPIQFNTLLWIFGAGSKQQSAAKILVSENARQWDTIDAPWPERLSPAVCIMRGKIFIGGGNHPVISGNNTRDSLLNDIWQME